ncbi:MAG: YIP1 family protein [Sulfitobacter sp.]
MMQNAISTLVQTSLRAPRDAAQSVINMQLSRDVLWTALALVAVLNTFLVLLVVEVSGPSLQLPSYFSRPLVLFILIAGLSVVYVHAMFWAGGMIGGKGTLMDVLSIVVWFQILRALAQGVVLVLSVAVPALGSLMSFVVAFWGLWIFMNFLSVALKLSTPWHSILVMFVAFVGLVLGLGVLIALIGGFAQGVTS